MADQDLLNVHVAPRERHLSGEVATARPDPCAVVIFGATGDLTARKLAPALYNLFSGWLLPEQVAIVGVGRRGSREEFLTQIRAVAEKFLGKRFKAPIWDRFARTVEYVLIDPVVPEEYARLRTRLEEIDKEKGTQGNRVFYLATPPSLFAPIVTSLRSQKLVYEDPHTSPWSRVIIEKPFGTDLESAQSLNAVVSGALHEKQIYRIDHYLGKETVQNLLVFRFANTIFEPLWSRNHIDHVQITMAESIGLEGRGAFYDKAGVLRDVIQNHILQVMALVAMEPPVSFRADDVRDRKIEVLRTLRPITPESVRVDCVRAQFAGYEKEKGVADGSQTPTYMAMRTFVDNWRWQGVPFYLRAGKALASRTTEIVIQFKRIPMCMFDRQDATHMSPNLLVLRIQPNEGISLRFAAKAPGEQLNVANIHMDMTYDEAFGQNLADAYERLLLDCMRGDATLFERRDGVEAAWRFVTPLLHAWDDDRTIPVARYGFGSAGPSEADELLSRDGFVWRPMV